MLCQLFPRERIRRANCVGMLIRYVTPMATTKEKIEFTIESLKEYSEDKNRWRKLLEKLEEDPLLGDDYLAEHHRNSVEHLEALFDEFVSNLD